MTTFLKHRRLIFFLNLSIIHPHNKIIIVLNSSLRYVLGPTPPSDKRNNLPHNSVCSQYLVLYLLRFFLSRNKFAIYLKCLYPHEMFPSNLLQPAQCAEVSAWFNPGWQPQAQLGDGNAPKAAQSSPNPLDLRLPPADMEPQINVTRNLSYLNQAEVSLHGSRNTSHKCE